MNTNTTSMSRRAFLGLGATAAVAAGAAGLAGCAPQGKDAAAGGTADAGAAGGTGMPEPTAYVPSFLTKPEPPAEVTEEKDCDVLVIGLGLSGVAAARRSSASRSSPTSASCRWPAHSAW